MVRKFQLFLKDRTAWKLLFRTAFQVLALLWAAVTGFGFWPTFVFLAVSALNYFSLSEERRTLRVSFWLLIFVAYFSIRFAAHPSLTAMIFLLFAFLLFLIFCLAHLLFADRFLFYGVLNTGLLLFVFLPVFFFSRPETLFGSLILIFPLMFLFWSEYFELLDLRGSRRRLGALIFSLLTAEAVPLIMLLPLGFVNAAAFLTLVFVFFRDGFTANEKGGLNLSFLLRGLAFFVFFAILILAAANWSVY